MEHAECLATFTAMRTRSKCYLAGPPDSLSSLSTFTNDLDLAIHLMDGLVPETPENDERRIARVNLLAEFAQRRYKSYGQRTLDQRIEDLGRIILVGQERVRRDPSPVRTIALADTLHRRYLLRPLESDLQDAVVFGKIRVQQSRAGQSRTMGV
jgi:hypothetical protein